MREIKFRAWDEVNKKMNYNPAVKYFQGLYSLDNQPLMQYTGLKDKNGTPIYEGDIVKWATDGLAHTIQWSDMNAGFAIVSTSGGITLYEFDTNELHEAEVIGNIYANPNLLKEESKC